jgi:hypothetical protein
LAACSKNDSASPAVAGSGQGGSTARFAISGNHLYTVGDRNLSLFDISNPATPQKQKDIPIGWGVETIFPYGDKLFIGTQTGMQIFNIAKPETPVFLSGYQHVVSCDPVVTDGRYAYVTLSTGTACRIAINQLQIVDLQNIINPTLIAQYDLTNPKGLGIDQNTLFVCDDGLKMYDATNVKALVLKKHFPINAHDVIPNNGRLLVIGSDGFYQYRYTANELELLSKIAVEPGA